MKVEVSTWSPPARARRLFSATLHDGNVVEIGLRQFGVSDGVSVNNFAKELYKSVSEDPIDAGGDWIRPSENVCTVAASLAHAQTSREENLAYTDRELIVLMLDDNFMAMASEAFDWIMASAEDEVTADEKKPVTRKRPGSK